MHIKSTKYQPKCIHNTLDIPCIPTKWDGFKVTRKFRGYTLNIEIINPNHVSKGVKEITIDGNKIEGNIIPVLEKGKEYQVLVTLG